MKTAVVRASARGGTLIVVLLMIAVLAMAVGAYYQTLAPKFRATYHGSSWQEALHGAEAGADVILRQLNAWAATAADPDAYPWEAAGWSWADPGFVVNGARNLPKAELPVLGGTNRVRVTSAVVDVYTRTPGLIPWYRIRATARADLPGRYVGNDRRDTRLRRMKLGARANGAPDPHVTRTVEVIAAPRFRFSRAITTVASMELAQSSQWEVDSFDSGDPQKSAPGTPAGGVYPAATPSEIQANGGIASARPAADATTYAPLIVGNGATVRGDVRTNGGDDPATAAHENVSGSQNMDSTRIRADFDEDILPIETPVWTEFVMSPAGTTIFAPGTASAPSRYHVGGNLGTFAVSEPPPGSTGYVEIIVAGNLATGNGANAGITIPPNVFAKIYVKGDVDFGNGRINANAASSKVASHLAVYGAGPFGSYIASGNAVQILTFYGPNYDVTVSGTVQTHGAIVARNFKVNGGGNGGFHYDEALGRDGDVVGWEVVSYVEDVRSDL